MVSSWTALKLAFLETFLFQTGFQAVCKDKKEAARICGGSTQLTLKEEQSQRVTSSLPVGGEWICNLLSAELLATLIVAVGTKGYQ